LFTSSWRTGCHIILWCALLDGSAQLVDLSATTCPSTCECNVAPHCGFARPQAQHADDWMARYFFSGDTMPSADLLLHFQVCRRVSCQGSANRPADCISKTSVAVTQDDLSIQNQWFVNGKHYSKTLEAWLQKMDAQKDSIIPVFEVHPTASHHTVDLLLTCAPGTCSSNTGTRNKVDAIYVNLLCRRLTAMKLSNGGFDGAYSTSRAPSSSEQGMARHQVSGTTCSGGIELMLVLRTCTRSRDGRHATATLHENLHCQDLMRLGPFDVHKPPSACASDTYVQLHGPPTQENAACICSIMSRLARVYLSSLAI